MRALDYYVSCGLRNRRQNPQRQKLNSLSCGNGLATLESDHFADVSRSPWRQSKLDSKFARGGSESVQQIRFRRKSEQTTARGFPCRRRAPACLTLGVTDNNAIVAVEVDRVGSYLARVLADGKQKKKTEKKEEQEKKNQ